MQKKLFSIMLGLIALISIPVSQTFGQDFPDFRVGEIAMGPIAPNANWSSPSYQPETWDKIVFVNSTRVRNEGDFAQAIRHSPETVILTLIDHRTHKFYYLKTRLWPPHSQTRLGIYVRNSFYHDGVLVTGCMPDTPGMHCRYLKGQIAPVFED